MRTAIVVMLVAVGSVSGGCSLCAPGYLCDYATVGGKWQRSDPENGRVGSILSDPNSVVGASIQSADAITINDSIYEEGSSTGDSILESPMQGPPTAEKGVIILGDQW